MVRVKARSTLQCESQTSALTTSARHLQHPRQPGLADQPPAVLGQG